MHMVNAAVLEEWTILPDEAVVSHVLDGQVALFEILMRRHNERLYRAARCTSSKNGRREKSYGSHVTCGTSAKFSVGGGDGISHSSPVAPHGFLPLTRPRFSDQRK